jgi:hypothetical protein
MVNGFTVDPEELRAHAGHLEELKGRFDAVMDASTHIEQDDEAYGTLCGWIAGILEQRHQDHSRITAYLAENFTIAAQSLRSCADDYETSDTESQGAFSELEGRMGV